MSELNKKFPAILLSWISGNGYTMTPDECNELTKYVSGLEVENARLAGRVEELEKAINGYINVCQSRYSMTEFLDASVRLEVVVGRRKPL